VICASSAFEIVAVIRNPADDPSAHVRSSFIPLSIVQPLHNLRRLIDKGVLGGGAFETDDIYKTYEELKAHGVEFQGPPTVQDWGTATVMKDNSGNWFSLSYHSPAKTAE
jgi:hypothetical protein